VRIVLISPNAAERTALAELLRAEGHDVIATARRQEGLLATIDECPDVIIADAQVADLDGLALVEEVSRHCARPRMILLSSRTRRSLRKSGVICVPKPIDLAVLQRHMQPLPQQRLA